ncbi:MULTISPECIES: hypothetical protein [Micromonospora]|uniref:hypothetical protein n=1 Tax=Micromonospora TaxID=1873 RepID=UPI0005C69646|nr:MULTISPECIES: hypothetical protein [Micromonospora]
MALRRHATRLAAVCVMLGGLVAAGASPALAEGDSVRVRATDSFRPGGSPGAVNVEVRKRTEGCVVLRTGLGLSLAGLAANQVTAQVSLGGRWVPVPVSGGGGAVATGRSAPTNPTLCKGKGVTMRYRLTFAAGAPGGRLTVVGEALDGRGRAIGRDAVAAKVVGPRAASPSPTPSRSPSRSPSPSPSPTAEPTTDAPTAGEPTLAAVAAEAGGPGTVAAAEEGSGGLSWIMLFGVGLVVLGVGLIVLLVRRSRADREPAADADAVPGVPLPRNPGGTTYRSATPAPPTPGRTPPTPGVYGRPAAPPSGGVYGARPGPSAAPPPTGGVYGGGAAQPAGGGGSGPGEPPAPAGGGDATTIMPRLPG